MFQSLLVDEIDMFNYYEIPPDLWCLVDLMCLRTHLNYSLKLVSLPKPTLKRRQADEIDWMRFFGIPESFWNLINVSILRSRLSMMSNTLITDIY